MKSEQPKRGETRERILDLTESAVLEKSFANTSLEEIIAAAGMSKNGFFLPSQKQGRTRQRSYRVPHGTQYGLDGSSLRTVRRD